jgi:hypothetical protein
VDAVQAHLDAFNESVEGVETPAILDPPVVPPVEKVKETPAEKVEETPAEKIEDVPVVPVEEAAPATPAVSTLPAAYVRTAKARGWTDQEIADFTKASPDLSMKTFERMHESRTKEIQEWAELGRKVRQTPAQVTAQPVVPSVVPVTSAGPAVLAPINVPDMVAKFGNQELIEALAGPVNAAIAALGPIVQGARSAQETAVKTQKETLGKIVHDFFTAKEMVPFAASYGTDEAVLTAPQITTRQSVLEMADALLAGAAFQGRRLSVQEALTLAHDSVSSGIKESTIREKIRTSVTRREKQITLKPTATGRRAAGGPPRDRQELIGRTEERLAQAFG